MLEREEPRHSGASLSARGRSMSADMASGQVSSRAHEGVESGFVDSVGMGDASREDGGCGDGMEYAQQHWGRSSPLPEEEEGEGEDVDAPVCDYDQFGGPHAQSPAAGSSDGDAANKSAPELELGTLASGSIDTDNSSSYTVKQVDSFPMPGMGMGMGSAHAVPSLIGDAADAVARGFAHHTSRGGPPPTRAEVRSAELARRWSIIDSTSREPSHNFALRRRQSAVSSGSSSGSPSLDSEDSGNTHGSMGAVSTGSSFAQRRRSIKATTMSPGLRQGAYLSPSLNNIMARTSVRSGGSAASSSSNAARRSQSMVNSVSTSSSLGSPAAPTKANTSQASLQSGSSSSSARSTGRIVKHSFTVLMCGGECVGKTAMAVRFTRGYFQEQHTMCPVDRFTKTIQFDDCETTLHIVDTPGKNQLHPDHESYYVAADGFMVLYSVTDQESIRTARAIIQRIRHLKGPDARIILCANKADSEAAEVRRKDVQQMFDLPIMCCSQLSPRAASPFYTMAKLLEYGPSLMPPKKKGKGALKKSYEKVPMRDPVSSMAPSYVEQERELADIYGSLQRSASESSVNGGRKHDSSRGGGGFARLFGGKRSHKRHEQTKHKKSPKSASKSNLSSISPGLRRSMSDGDLIIEETVLQPRRKRSHSFNSTIAGLALPDTEPELGTPPTKANHVAKLATSPSALLPRELVESVSRKRLVSVETNQGQQQQDEPSTAQAPGGDSPETEKVAAAATASESSPAVPPRPAKSSAGLSEQRRSQSQLNQAQSQDAQGLDQQPQAHAEASAGDADVDGPSSASVGPLVRRLSSTRSLSSITHRESPTSAVPLPSAATPPPTVERRRTFSGRPAPVDVHHVTCRTNDVSLYPDERICDCKDKMRDKLKGASGVGRTVSKCVPVSEKRSSKEKGISGAFRSWFRKSQSKEASPA